MTKLRMTLAALDAAKLKITRNPSPAALPPKDQLVFGQTMTNHMLIAKWDASTGWATPEILPYGPLSLMPSACVLHYSFECFEGLKAFKDAEGQLRMFRPRNNMVRLNNSSRRICLPNFDPDEGVKLLQEFVKLEQDMIPVGRGYSLYLRPTMIGTQPGLGVSTPKEAMLFVIASPVGLYYSTGFKALRLEANDHYARAWPGGTGNQKLGGNYAPCILPQLEAAQRGFQQNLWIFDGYLTEVGTMNLFLVFEDQQTKRKELTTAPLDGTILEGITRLSILELARERLDSKEWDVTERKVHISELKDRAAKGELLEVFGAGTAAIVSPVKEINYHDEPILVDYQGKESGPITEQVLGWVHDIQYGVETHAFAEAFATAE